MYFDRFDIAAAWYLFLMEYHGGQGSKSYSRLSKLSRSFRPGPLFNADSLTENAWDIYQSLCDKAEKRHA